MVQRSVEEAGVPRLELTRRWWINIGRAMKEKVVE